MPKRDMKDKKAYNYFISLSESNLDSISRVSQSPAHP